MEKFKFAGLAEICHINARKEGPEDDKVLAVDIKFKAQVLAHAGLYFDDMLGEFLLREDGSIRNIFLDEIRFSQELEDYALTLHDKTHFGVKLKKFIVSASGQGVLNIQFQASFKPDGDEVATLAEFLQEDVRIQLMPANRELDLEAQPEDKVAQLNDALGDLVPETMYEEAKSLVIAEQRASISMVQRGLRIGYNRAAMLLEQMEAEGVVSPMDATGKRTVLVAQEAA